MMMRLFLAIQVPDEVIDEAVPLQMGLPGARWTEPDQMHLTLRFVGDADGVQYQDIGHAMRRIRHEPFDVELTGLGVFPPKGAARTLWLGVAQSERLAALQRKVDMAVTRLGFKSTRKRWIPHVTLARLGGTPSSRLGNYIAGNAMVRLPAFEATGFSLYTSTLHPSGSIYEVEETFELGL